MATSAAGACFSYLIDHLLPRLGETQVLNFAIDS